MEPVQPAASVAGPGLSIRYIGEHAYGMNVVPAATGTKTALDFTSGSGYIVATFTFNNASDPDGAGNSINTTASVKFNGEIVLVSMLGSTALDMPVSTQCDMIIPPFTHVQGFLNFGGTNSAYFGSIVLSGRVYGAK